MCRQPLIANHVNHIGESIANDVAALRRQRREYRRRNRNIRLPVERVDRDHRRRLIRRQRLEVRRVSIGDVAIGAVRTGVDGQINVLRGYRLAGDDLTLQRRTHAESGLDRPARRNLAEADDLIRIRQRIAGRIHQLGLAADEEFEAGVKRRPE